MAFKSIIRKALRYHESVRKEIKIVVGFFFVAWVIKVFLLNSMPAHFDFFLKIGDLFEKLCASIISSYVFYFFVVHWKAENDKEILADYVAHKTKLIVSVCLQQLLNFENHPKPKQSEERILKLETIDKSKINNQFEKMNPLSEAPLAIGFSNEKKLIMANWVQYIASCNEKTQRYIDILFKRITVLDSELIELLSSIEDSIEFSMLKHTNSINNDENLTILTEPFFDYCKNIKRLDEYRIKKGFRSL